MCGIAGWMALPQHAPEDGAMAPVLEALAHRGPDGAGAYAFQSSQHRVVLGHRRLAIAEVVDLAVEDDAHLAVRVRPPVASARAGPPQAAQQARFIMVGAR